MGHAFCVQMDKSFLTLGKKSDEANSECLCCGTQRSLGPAAQQRTDIMGRMTEKGHSLSGEKGNTFPVRLLLCRPQRRDSPTMCMANSAGSFLTVGKDLLSITC